MDSFKLHETMISKNQLKLVKALKLKKKREENALFVAEGSKTVSDILDSDLKVMQLYAKAEWLEGRELPKDVSCTVLDDRSLQQLSFLKTAQDVLAVVHMPDHKMKAQSKGNLILALDGIRDPGNMGTIIRLADWFGVAEVLCSNDCVDLYNPKTVQATMGSIARVAVSYTELAESLATMKNDGYACCGAVLGGENMYKEAFEGKLILVMGNESNGVRAEIMALTDKHITIPDFGTGEIDSLNVATACSILLSEIRSRKYR